MKFAYDTDDPSDVDPFETYSDDDLSLEPITVDGYELLTDFHVFGASVTAPKGKIRLAFDVRGDKLEDVMQIVKHSGKRMVCMIFAPKRPFDDDLR